MFENFNNLIIGKIAIAMYVAPGTGTAIHNNRPFHGLVLSSKGRNVDIIFSDGTVLKTLENDILYLPKGSDYTVVTHSHGEGCWAINFDLLDEINTKPFVIKFQNTEQLTELFKKSITAFYNSNDYSNMIIRKNLYQILLTIKKEYDKKYIPSEKTLLLKPAVDIMNTQYMNRDLTVENLSAICGISVAYFRRLFTEKYSVSPKEYIIKRRMDYAKKLIISQQFSISEIAEMCGYFEPCHFSRKFKRYFNVSPSNFSKNNATLS
ncbi:MAG: AraC family transcriptional regulator [Acutalibacteraceae bacterium]|nr:AraC family transcriptional regulator [Acutalibacteraceae bacterium]